jgi:hypothetical protein
LLEELERVGPAEKATGGEVFHGGSSEMTKLVVALKRENATGVNEG